MSISGVEGLMQSPNRQKKRIDSRLRSLQVQSYDNNHMTKGADDFKTIDDSRILKNSNDLSDSPTKLSKNKTNASPMSRERVRKRKVMLASAIRLSTPARQIF